MNKEIAANGIENVNYESLKPILEGRSLNGIASSYIYVINEEGTFLYHKKEEKIDTKVTNAAINQLLTEIPTGKYVAADISRYTDENGVVKYSAYQVMDSTGWVTVCVADDTDIMARAVANMETNLREIVERISNTSVDLEGHALRLKDITMEIDSANADNSATSEELAASMEETSATTDLISERATLISQNANDIAEEAWRNR